MLKRVILYSLQLLGTYHVAEVYPISYVAVVLQDYIVITHCLVTSLDLEEKLLHFSHDQKSIA